MKKIVLLLLTLICLKGFTQTNNKKLISSNKSNKIDTVSLDKFWRSFQYNLLTKNKDSIIAILDFPVHALFPVIFQYAYDCDTVLYSKNEDKYHDFDITKANINQYFSFVFSDTLIKIVQQISTQRLLKNGVDKDSEGLTYECFPKDYIKVNCPNDHLYMFYITKKANIWHLGIGGL
ncbi:MAG TPA: hypothetical protein VNX01_07605 [Bacteroidia bacterium]|nr:hypothetical protein [Bacteroidia bacterium]